MTIKVENVAKEIAKKGQHAWYKWKIFLDEPVDVINRIKEVVYQLHPTFPNPKRVVREQNTHIVLEGRGAHFVLEGEGWGSFTVLVTIRYKDGREETTPYFLDLSKQELTS